MLWCYNNGRKTKGKQKMIVLYVLLAALVLVLATSLICFLKIFYTSRRKKWPEYPVPEGEIYAPHHEQMIEWIKYARALSHTEVSIRSFDGLKLSGTYILSPIQAM